MYEIVYTTKLDKSNAIGILNGHGGRAPNGNIQANSQEAQKHTAPAVTEKVLPNNNTLEAKSPAAARAVGVATTPVATGRITDRNIPNRPHLGASPVLKAGLHPQNGHGTPNGNCPPMQYLTTAQSQEEANDASKKRKLQCVVDAAPSTDNESEYEEYVS